MSKSPSQPSVAWVTGVGLAAVAAGIATSIWPIVVAIAVTVVGYLGLLFLTPRTHINLVALLIVTSVNVALPFYQLISVSTIYMWGVIAVCVSATTAAFVRGSHKCSEASVAVVLVSSFAGIAMLSLAFSPDAQYGGSLGLLIMMLCAASLGVRLESRQQEIYICSLVAISALEAGYAIVEATLRIAPLWVGAYQPRSGASAALYSDVLPGLARAQGTLGHGIPLASLLLVGLVVVSTARVIRPYILVVAVQILLVTGIVFSGTRSALVIIPFALVLALPIRNLALRAALLVAGCVAVFATLGGSTLGVTQLVGLTNVTSTGSYTHRVGAFDALVRLWENNSLIETVFGHGYASIPRLFAEGYLQNSGLRTVDNQFIELFAQVGLLGTALILVLFVRAILRSATAGRAALTIVLLAFMIFGVLDRPAIFVIAFAFIGLADRPRSEQVPLSRNGQVPPGRHGRDEQVAPGGVGIP